MATKINKINSVLDLLDQSVNKSGDPINFVLETASGVKVPVQLGVGPNLGGWLLFGEPGIVNEETKKKYEVNIIDVWDDASSTLNALVDWSLGWYPVLEWGGHMKVDPAKVRFQRSAGYFAPHYNGTMLTRVVRAKCLPEYGWQEVHVSGGDLRRGELCEAGAYDANETPKDRHHRNAASKHNGLDTIWQLLNQNMPFSIGFYVGAEHQVKFLDRKLAQFKMTLPQRALDVKLGIGKAVYGQAVKEADAITGQKAAGEVVARDPGAKVTHVRVHGGGKAAISSLIGHEVAIMVRSDCVDSMTVTSENVENFVNRVHSTASIIIDPKWEN